MIGAGHSAINVPLDLVRLGAEAPSMRVTWATRRGGLERLLGGGASDQLPERGWLGLEAAEAIRSGRVALLSPFAARRIEPRPDGLVVHAEHDGAGLALEVDRVVVASGFWMVPQAGPARDRTR